MSVHVIFHQLSPADYTGKFSLAVIHFCMKVHKTGAPGINAQWNLHLSHISVVLERLKGLSVIDTPGWLAL